MPKLAGAISVKSRRQSLTASDLLDRDDMRDWNRDYRIFGTRFTSDLNFNLAINDALFDVLRSEIDYKTLAQAAAAIAGA